MINQVRNGQIFTSSCHYSVHYGVSKNSVISSIQLILPLDMYIIVFALWGQSLHYNQNQTKESEFMNAKHTSPDRNLRDEERILEDLPLPQLNY